MLLKNYDNQPFPEAFLKRWIKTQEKDITDEKIETDYPLMLKDLTWTLIKNQILKVNDIKVEMADIEAEARQYSRAMFAQYGMQNVPEEYVEQQVKELIKKEDSVRQFANRASENKVVEFVKSKVKLETKKISLDNFNKMFEK
jgi:trigger factor